MNEDYVSSLDSLQEKLVRDHIESANNIARREYNKAKHVLDLDELKGEAYYGLFQAAKNWYSHCQNGGWDPHNVKPFYLYASPRMRGAIIDNMRAKERGWSSRALRARGKLLEKNGQIEGASIAELAERTGMTKEQVFDTINALSKRPVSLEGEDIDSPVVVSTESSFLVTQLLITLVEVIGSMDDMSKVVLALHYYQHVQLKRISGILGVNEHRVTELHANAVIRIRQVLEQAALGNNIDLGLDV